jgi:hypothetical protein
MLLPCLAPYLNRAASQSAFWHFVYKWTVGLIVATLAAMIAYVSFDSLVMTIKTWISAGLEQELKWRGGIVIYGFILPVVWLALTPENFDKEYKSGERITPRALPLLVRYGLIPLSLAFSALPVANTARMIWISSYVTAPLGISLIYASGIILVALMIYPYRQESTYLRLYWRFLPLLLITPSILIFSTLWVRIEENGWTPFPYFALIGGVWASAVALIYSVPHLRGNLRLMHGLLVLLLAATAFGPWGVSQVSGRSQFARLEDVLSRHGSLADGKWQALGAIEKISWGDVRTVETALRTLAKTGELERLRPWFAEESDDPFATANTSRKLLEAIRAKIGIRSWSNSPKRH